MNRSTTLQRAKADDVRFQRRLVHLPTSSLLKQGVLKRLNSVRTIYPGKGCSWAPPLEPTFVSYHRGRHDASGRGRQDGEILEGMKKVSATCRVKTSYHMAQAGVCFFCAGELEYPVVYWAGAGSYVFLHPVCAEKLAIRLGSDALAAQKTARTPLGGTLGGTR